MIVSSKPYLSIALLVWGLIAQGGTLSEANPPGASLEELLALARDHNPEVIASRQEALAAREGVEPAGAFPDPRFRSELMDITRSGQQDPSLWPDRVASARYTLMQEIPWFGKRALKQGIAEQEAISAQGMASASWAEVASQVKISQAQRYYLAHNEALTREILALMVRLEKVTQARYAAGLGVQQDVIRAQVEQTNLNNELLALTRERRQQDIRLNRLLARPATAPLADAQQLPSLPTPTQLVPDQLVAQLIAASPTLAAAESRWRGAEKNRELTYRNRYPDFTLGVAANQFQGSTRAWDVMVEVNIPLQQDSRRHQEHQAQAQAEAAQAQRNATADQLQATLAENLAALESAQRSEALITKSLLPQAELTFRSALAGYEAGQVDFATLLEAQRQIRQGRQNQLKTQLEGQMGLAEIERLLGRLLEQ